MSIHSTTQAIDHSMHPIIHIDRQSDTFTYIRWISMNNSRHHTACLPACLATSSSASSSLTNNNYDDDDSSTTTTYYEYDSKHAQNDDVRD